MVIVVSIAQLPYAAQTCVSARRSHGPINKVVRASHMWDARIVARNPATANCATSWGYLEVVLKYDHFISNRSRKDPLSILLHTGRSLPGSYAAV